MMMTQDEIDLITKKAKGLLTDAEKQSSRKYKVLALLSDLHLQAEGRVLARVFNYKWEEALHVLKVLEPDYWVINGDICDHGHPEELKAFEEIFKAVAPAGELLVTTGNHEFLGHWEELITLWQETFHRQPLYTNVVIDGVHVVLLANEWRSDLSGADSWITEKQIKWFRKALEDNKQKPTVVFMHQPLPDTLTPAKLGTSLGRHQQQELLDILAHNPQIKLWFSGHTHYRLGPGEMCHRNGVYFVGMGATSYLPDHEHGLSQEDLELSHCRVLEIQKDSLRVRTVDLRKCAWIDSLEITVELEVDPWQRIGASNTGLI